MGVLSVPMAVHPLLLVSLSTLLLNKRLTSHNSGTVNFLNFLEGEFFPKELNEYTFRHRLWINGVAYCIDPKTGLNKNWGRYIILKHEGKNVVLNDREKELLAVPAFTPLPRLLQEALILYSGKSPRKAKIEHAGVTHLYNLYENIPHILGYNSLLKVGQKIIEIHITEQ